ncbi:MAG: hypothetical protein AAF682_24145 [Planctomycetota bacterium]
MAETAMNAFFCKIFGCTWVPVTLTPSQRWHTTKDGHTLKQAEVRASEIRHIDRCARCGSERDAGPRRHDGDVFDAEAAAETEAAK